MALRGKIRNILNNQGKAKFSESARHAMDGINYVIMKERNFKIEIIFGILVSIAGIYFNVSILEWLVLVVTIAIVLCLEMVNTAIERTVDLVTKEYNELAKISKDVAAGAVLIMSMFSVVVGIIIFLPKILLMFR